MMLSAWKMDEAADKQEAATRKRAAQDNDIFGTSARREDAEKKESNLPKIGDNANDQELIKHIRERIAARGARGIQGIGKKFKIADDDRSGALCKEEFKKAMHDFRIGLNQAQVGKAFNIFDRDGSGEISYDEFLRSIRGRMNPGRAAIAKQCYSIMDSDKSG
jgi:hypothetical protein